MRICDIVNGAGDARGSGRGRTAPAAPLRKRLANSRSHFGLLSVSRSPPAVKTSLMPTIRSLSEFGERIADLPLIGDPLRGQLAAL